MSSLSHIGTKRHSGRYPWGSGKKPQRSTDFTSAVDTLRKQGLSDSEIAKGFGMTTDQMKREYLYHDVAKKKRDNMKETDIAEAYGMTTKQLRATYSLAKDEVKKERIAEVLKRRDAGMSNAAIAEELGVTEATVRNYLNPEFAARTESTKKTADVLAAAVKDKKYIDVGSGVEYQLGVSRVKMDTAVAMLEQQGYKKSYLKQEQATNPGKHTWIQVLTKDDVPYSEIVKNKDLITSPHGTYSNDNGNTFLNIKPPAQLEANRVMVRYKEDGGIDKDGCMEIRRGVKDVSLGSNTYAQVRIAVGGTHYLKGMAVYGDDKDFPPGVDIIFNTNKSKGTPMMGDKYNSVLKPLKDDPDNPFGAVIRQMEYEGSDGKKHLSKVNLVKTESDLDHYSNTVASQMLSKQRPNVAKKQLDITYQQKLAEFNEISALTQPMVRKKMLLDFADQCDSDAVNMKAAHFPGQDTHFIIPFPKMKDTEIYAPNYKNGEEVILIRYPHEGVFQIPKLTVNNNVRDAKKTLGSARHAVGINSKVAEQLSGADFDGDTVLCIPTRGIDFKTSKPLKDLVGYDPKDHYKLPPSAPDVGPKTGFQKQLEMGKISNLITDLTIAGAKPEEIARAVRHSMCVIDAEKHHLDWRRSEEENGIAALKQKYRGRANAGASTLISAAKSPVYVNQREDRYSIDPATGKKLFKETGETYRKSRKLVDANGNDILNPKTGKPMWEEYGPDIRRRDTSTKLYEADDAYSLSSGSPIESVYASYSNRMKTLGNEARKSYLKVPPEKYSPEAKKKYAVQVKELNNALADVHMNAPKERKAQLIAAQVIAMKKQANPDMDKDQLKKIKQKAIDEARNRVGASGRDAKIKITPTQWEAIQAGAISNTKLKDILDHADMDIVRQLATPRNDKRLNEARLSRIKSLLAAGYTQSEVADSMGVSVSTINKALSGKEAK